MSQKLPMTDFAIVSQEQVQAIESELVRAQERVAAEMEAGREPDAQSLMTFTKPAEDIGYFFEVDLEYPEELHPAHQDYPLAPERLNVAAEEKSLLQQALEMRYERRPQNCSKLVPNLHDKRNYQLHYQNLLYYMQLGMRLVKIHRAVMFREEAWLAPYISLCTELRKKALSPFERDLFKLFINIIFGKSCEKLDDRTDIRLVQVERQFRQLMSRPHCKNFRIFANTLAAVELRKPQIVIDRPMYIGTTVLDLSKLHMYKLHYGHFRAVYGNMARLLYTDTDSLIYHIETDNVLAECYEHKEDVFDMSTLPPTSPYFDDTKKNVPGYLKVETGGKQMTEFVALAAKMYSYKMMTPETGDEQESRRAKGIQAAVVKRDFRHEHYLQQLYDPQPNRVETRRIGSHYHILYTYKVWHVLRIMIGFSLI